MKFPCDDFPHKISGESNQSLTCCSFITEPHNCGFMAASQLLSCDNDLLLFILQKSLKSVLCQGLCEGVGKCQGSKEILKYSYSC